MSDKKFVKLSPLELRKMSKPEREKYIERLKAWASEPVTGRFKNNDIKGGSVAFNLKIYPGDDYTKDWDFMDGEVYTIPYFVAEHLNENCFFYEYKHLPQSGQFAMQKASNARGRIRTEDITIKRKIHRYEFIPLDFMSESRELFPSRLVEVTQR